MSTRRWNRSLLAVTGTMVLAASTLMAAPTTSAEDGPSLTVVASGLDNPRLLSFSGDGSLYVAEAGIGGNGPCVAGPEGPACFGTSGAVTRISNGHQARVLRALPSLASPEGFAALGPADVSVAGLRYAVTIGLGNDPAVRDQLPAAGKRMGTLITGTLPAAISKVLANLASFEAANNPDGNVPDSNPVGFSRAGLGYVVADAGGNDLLAVTASGKISVIAVFPDRLVDAPSFLPPGQIPMQAVPTSVVRGSDGAWYVSQLTGFPFPAGAANIYRVVPGQPPTVYASGLTNVTDLAWSGGQLYAVEIAGDAGLLAAEGLPMGSLVRINPDGSHSAVADDLPAPYGVAMRGGVAYVTTCSVCPGAGSVVRIPLS